MQWVVSATPAAARVLGLPAGCATAVGECVAKETVMQSTNLRGQRSAACESSGGCLNKVSTLPTMVQRVVSLDARQALKVILARCGQAPSCGSASRRRTTMRLGGSPLSTDADSCLRCCCCCESACRVRLDDWQAALQFFTLRVVSGATLSTPLLPSASFCWKTPLICTVSPADCHGARESVLVELDVRDRGLLGGKGGFGALLRGKKAKPNTDNVDDCRDLQTGQRLRDVQRQRMMQQLLQDELADDSQQQQQQPQQQQQQQQNDKRKRGAADQVHAEERKLKQQRRDAAEHAARAKLVSTTQDAVEAGVAAALRKKLQKAAGGSDPSAASTTSQPVETKDGFSSDSSLVENLAADSPESTGHSSDGSEPAGQDPLDLVADAAALESWGPDKLKDELMRRGLKCGGSLSQRAERLFAVKGLEPGEIPHRLLAPLTSRRR